MSALCTARLVSSIPQLVRTTLARTTNLPRTGATVAVAQSRRTLATTLLRRSDHIFNVQDDADFKARVLENEKPVLVDFHADWCGPCKLLGPRLEKAIASKEGKVLLARVDVDDLDDLAAEYNIRSLPTVMAMKKGNETDRFIGLLEDDLIDSFIEKALH